MRIILALGALLAVLACSHGFLLGSVGHARAKRASRTVVSMGIWDAIKAGFENEQIDTPPPSAGLKNVSRERGVEVDWRGWGSHWGSVDGYCDLQGPQTVKITFLPSKKVVEAVAGQKLSDVVSAARIPVRLVSSWSGYAFVNIAAHSERTADVYMCVHKSYRSSSIAARDSAAPARWC